MLLGGGVGCAAARGESPVEPKDSAGTYGAQSRARQPSRHSAGAPGVGTPTSGWVELTPTGFQVHAVSDVDGDGIRAEYIATGALDATLQTPPDVH